MATHEKDHVSVVENLDIEQDGRNETIEQEADDVIGTVRMTDDNAIYLIPTPTADPQGEAFLSTRLGF